MILQKAKAKLIEHINDRELLDQEIIITCKALKKEEAIGNPLHNDYPIQTGKEKIIEANLLGKRGQAFSDAYFDYKGKIEDIMGLKLDTNAKRAIFVSTLNAVMAELGQMSEGIHCKDDELLQCADHFREFVKNTFNQANKVLLVGLQPRLLGVLAETKQVRVCDKNPDNYRIIKSGVEIESPEAFPKNAEWADAIIATGSTIVNNTIDEIYNTNPNTYFYGVTISGAAQLLGLNHFCYIMEE
jgi:hypothetical protein